MPTKTSIDGVIADGERVVRVWRENPTFSLGELTLAQAEAKIAGLRTLRGQIEEARTRLT
ncbi:MAG TPA: hypothetical protein VF723_14390 [Pyrinomonadaceae bacterium]|jgi:hypothetical protein